MHDSWRRFEVMFRQTEWGDSKTGVEGSTND